MITLETTNVNTALSVGYSLLTQTGLERPSRNGPVLVAPAPVTTVYEKPWQRVLLYRERDTNPFFHLVEALWMLAGRNDLATLTPYVSNMSNFSDDGGVTQPGAYGHRWRVHFKRDQLAWAIERLKADAYDRRVAISMYDVRTDQPATDSGGRDIPCNLIAIPWVDPSTGFLNLTVYNRSNDMVWGAYGANAVHFSVLQEFIAAALGRPIGRYWQVSNNFHAYKTTLGLAEVRYRDPYVSQVVPVSMFKDGERLEDLTADIQMFLNDPARVGIRNNFLRKVACPMVMAHRAWRAGRNEDAAQKAFEILGQIPPCCDWGAAAEMWISKRLEKLRRAADDGVNHE